MGTLAYLLFGLGALPSGIIAGLSNAKVMLTVFFFGVAAATAVIGLSTGFPMFVIGMALLGLAASIYHVTGPTLISHFAEKAGKAFGVHGAAGAAGVTLAPLSAGLMASLVSWRAAYLVLAVVAAVGGVVLALDRTIPQTKPEPRGNSASDFDRSRIVIFVLLMLIVTVNGFVYRAFMTMFPTHIGAEVPMQKLPSVLSGGLLASGILAFGMIGQYVAGVIADRVDRFRIYPIPVLASIPLMLLVGTTSGWSLIFVSVAFSLLFFPVQPLENVILGHYVPPKFVSSMFGLKYVLIFGVGSLGSVFSGYISETLGTPRVFTLLPAFSLITLSLALVALWLRRKGTSEDPRVPVKTQ